MLDCGFGCGNGTYIYQTFIVYIYSKNCDTYTKMIESSPDLWEGFVKVCLLEQINIRQFRMCYAMYWIYSNNSYLPGLRKYNPRHLI
jgi:hypothetical protein